VTKVRRARAGGPFKLLDVVRRLMVLSLDGHTVDVDAWRSKLKKKGNPSKEGSVFLTFPFCTRPKIENPYFSFLHLFKIREFLTFSFCTFQEITNLLFALWYMSHFLSEL
jgi:hypothetical protein